MVFWSQHRHTATANTKSEGLPLHAVSGIASSGMVLCSSEMQRQRERGWREGVSARGGKETLHLPVVLLEFPQRREPAECLVVPRLPRAAPVCGQVTQFVELALGLFQQLLKFCSAGNRVCIVVEIDELGNTEWVC